MVFWKCCYCSNLYWRKDQEWYIMHLLLVYIFLLMFAFRLHLAVKCAFSEITSSTVWACRSLLNSIATTLSKGDTKCLSTTSNTMQHCCSLQIEPKQSTTCSQAQLWQPSAQPNIGHQSTPSSSWPDLSKGQQLCAPAAVLLLVLKLASVQLWSRWAPCCWYPLVAGLLGRFSVAGWKLPLMWQNRERLSVHESLERGAESPPLRPAAHVRLVRPGSSCLFCPVTFQKCQDPISLLIWLSCWLLKQCFRVISAECKVIGLLTLENALFFFCFCLPCISYVSPASPFNTS